MPLEFILTKARIDYHSVIVADFFQEWGLLLGEVLKKRKERRKKKMKEEQQSSPCVGRLDQEEIKRNRTMQK